MKYYTQLYIGIIINHDEDPFEPIGIKGGHKGLERCSSGIDCCLGTAEMSKHKRNKSISSTFKDLPCLLSIGWFNCWARNVRGLVQSVDV